MIVKLGSYSFISIEATDAKCALSRTLDLDVLCGNSQHKFSSMHHCNWPQLKNNSRFIGAHNMKSVAISYLFRCIFWGFLMFIFKIKVIQI